MQTGTVWLRGRSWRFKIHFWVNIVHFRKSYICSNKLDVQETNCCFSQFNRIWNHLFGHWTEIRWVACSGIQMFLVFQIDRGNLRVKITNTTSLTIKSMRCKTLMLFLQMSNPRAKKLYCMCLRTMKQWSRWSLKEGVLQWDMFPGPTELRLIGCSIELIWIPKIKSNTSTPKTNFLTFWPKEISRVMSGFTCCACSILAISAPLCALIQWRNDLNKIQEENESQPNRDRWWILLPGRRRTYRPRLQ